MRKLKFIFKILLVLIFICSVFLNVVLLKSSYGSLIFKYDQVKISALSESSDEYLQAYFSHNTKRSIEFKVNKDGIASVYAFSVDEKNDVYMKLTTKEDDVDVIKYYADGKLYTEKGDSKTFISMSKLSIVSTYYAEAYSLLNFPTLKVSINDNENKTKPVFSFNPLYVLGIGYTCKNGTTSHSYKFDLKGRIREVNSAYDGGSTKVIVNYSNDQLTMPSFEGFIEK